MDYICFDNQVVNLDCKDIYPPKWLGMNICDLFSLCMSEAGTSLFYMDYLHTFTDWGSQKDRVAILCKELSDIWNNLRQFEPNAYKCTLLNEDEYRSALRSWLFRFKDETENQC